MYYNNLKLYYGISRISVKFTVRQICYYKLVNYIVKVNANIEHRWTTKIESLSSFDSNFTVNAWGLMIIQH